jgi:hypothetical protein
MSPAEQAVRDHLERQGSPTFVARFADSETTRMTTHTSLDRLDVERGVRLAQHAYRSRKKQEPPAIIEAWFESNGTRLASYDADALKAAGSASWKSSA